VFDESNDRFISGYRDLLPRLGLSTEHQELLNLKVKLEEIKETAPDATYALILETVSTMTKLHVKADLLKKELDFKEVLLEEFSQKLYDDSQRSTHTLIIPIANLDEKIIEYEVTGFLNDIDQFNFNTLVTRISESYLRVHSGKLTLTEIDLELEKIQKYGDAFETYRGVAELTAETADKTFEKLLNAVTVYLGKGYQIQGNELKELLFSYQENKSTGGNLALLDEISFVAIAPGNNTALDEIVTLKRNVVNYDNFETTEGINYSLEVKTRGGEDYHIANVTDLNGAFGADLKETRSNALQTYQEKKPVITQQKKIKQRKF